MGSFKSGRRTSTVCQDTSVVCQDRSVVCQDRSVVCQDKSVVCQDTPAVSRDKSVVCRDTSVVCQDTPVVCQDRSLAFSTVVVTVDAIDDVVVFFAAMSGKSGTFDVPFKTGRSRITDDQSKMANEYTTITSCLADGSN